MAIPMLQQTSRSEEGALYHTSTPPPSLPQPRSYEDTRSISLLQGRDLSRPSSTSTTQSSLFTAPSLRHESIRLPGLAALAQAAERRSVTPIPTQTPRPPRPPANMSYATSAPGQGSGFGSAPPICQNCSTSTTPLWRRDDSGSVLCNACGLFLKLHNRPRPISLKTDVIKSRNRIKTASGANTNGNTNNDNHESNGSLTQKEADGNVITNGSERPRFTQGLGLAAAHPSVASNPHHVDRHPQYAPAPQAAQLATQVGAISREGTPSNSTIFHEPHPQDQNALNMNIAPQHLFDSAATPADASQASHTNAEAENSDLRTRVSELEVINDLFRGRVSELELEVRELRALLEGSHHGSGKRKHDETAPAEAGTEAGSDRGGKRMRKYEATTGTSAPLNGRETTEEADDTTTVQ